MVVNFSKVQVLLWKCLLTRKRNWKLSLLELTSLLCAVALLHLILSSTIQLESNQLHQNGLTLYYVNQTESDPLFLEPVSANFAYTPANNVTDAIMKGLETDLKGSLSTPPVTKENETDLENWFRSQSSKGKESIGIVFHDFDIVNNIFEYKIRTNHPLMTTTDLCNEYTDMYKESDFLRLQRIIDTEILKVTGHTLRDDYVLFKQLPLPLYDTLDVLSYIYFCLGFCNFIYMLCVGSVLLQANCSGMKDMMPIIGGVSSKCYWIQWFLFSIILQFPFSFCFALLLSSFAPLFLPSTLFILWVLFFTYILNSTIILFVATCFFKNPTVGLVVCCFVWTVIHIFTLINFYYYDMIPFIGTVFYLIPLDNLMWELISITSFHGTWTISDLFRRGFEESRSSVAFAFTVSMLEMFILTLCLILVNAKPIYFTHGLQSLNFFCCMTRITRRDDTTLRTRKVETSAFEEPPEGIEVVIEFCDVTKKYGRSNKKTVIENVSLYVYEGEILCLLGHHAAGKSTLISLILGTILPSSGQILFYGKDVNRKKCIEQKHLGYCPQTNCKFPGFTVMELLVFFGMLRGLSNFDACIKGTYLLNLLNISGEKNYMVSNLSVEVRRRLFIAISLIEDSSVLILDEPTAGMSSQSRQEVWDTILKIKKHRTILITTCTMEEAEMLADRIAILDHGKVVSCGSTMFLKSIDKIGYHIQVFTKTSSSHTDITYLVKRHIPDSQAEVVSTNQINFIVREGALEQFPTFFEAIEGLAANLGIIKITVRCKGLEDVIKGLEGLHSKTAETLEEEDVFYEAGLDQAEPNTEFVKLYGCELQHRQFETLLWKRLTYCCRTLKHYFLFVMCIGVTLYVLSRLIYSEFHHQKASDILDPLTIKLDMCGKSINVISSDRESEGIARTATRLIQQQGGHVFNITSHANTNFMQEKLLFFNSLLNLSFTTDNITMMYRTKSHMASVAINIVSNTLLKNLTNSYRSHIQVINHPFKELIRCRLDRADFKSEVLDYWFYNGFIIFVLASLMTPQLAFLIEERTSGFKLQQLIAGVSPLFYVVTNFMFDYVLFLCTIGIYFTILHFSAKDVFPEFGNFYSLWFNVTLYGQSGLFFVYLVSYCIDSAIFGTFVFVILDCFVVFVMFMCMRAIEHLGIGLTTVLTCTSLFSINPLFATMMAISKSLEAYVEEFMCHICGDQNACQATSISILAMPSEINRNGIGLYLLILATEWILFLIIILILENQMCKRKGSKEHRTEEEEGPLDEPTNGGVNGNVEIQLKVHKLTKIKTFSRVAVNDVSFDVSKGECFGLLGSVGSGKSTVLKILAGDVNPTKGDAILQQYSILTNRREFQKNIGYCPKKDALLGVFTGEETLRMICLLKGLSGRLTRQRVEAYLKILGMTDCAKDRIGEYSSGLKRRLSAAMAFIGEPLIVLLDQPTRDIDPESRGRLWMLVESQRKAGQAIVLATDSMDECDALCTRLAVLKDGVVRCIGTPVHLKSNFVQGSNVLVKLKGDAGVDTESLREEFASSFPQSQLSNIRRNVMQCQIQEQVPLSLLFSELLRLRRKYDIIEDFTVRDATLDQLFASSGKKESSMLQALRASLRKSRLYRLLFRPSEKPSSQAKTSR